MNHMTEDQEFDDKTRMSGERYVWECAIGGRNPVTVPPGGDLPMREAVERAFKEVTGEHAEYTYSGWGRKFTDKALSTWPVPPSPQNGVGAAFAIVGGAALFFAFCAGIVVSALIW